MLFAELPQRPGLLGRQVGNDQPVDARLLCIVNEAIEAMEFLADGDLDGETSVDNLLATNKTLGTLHGNSADGVLTEMHGDLEDDTTATLDILDLEGVSKIEAEGQPFEPWEFEAVQYQETEDAEEGRVIEVVRNGYKRHDKVLRAAQVVVAKRPEPETGHEANEQEEQ